MRSYRVITTRRRGRLAAAALLLALVPGPVHHAERVTRLGTGLTVETVGVAAAGGDGGVTLVRIDPRHWRFRLLTAAEHGERTAPQWVADFGLTGVINASMFRPDQRSTGMMIDGDTANNGWDNPSFGAFLTFDPRVPELDPVRLTGRGCPDFDLGALRRDYRVLVQNYRILDCAGQPIAWRDEKRYSIAAVGVDRDNRVVFLHSRAPRRVRDFNRLIAAPEIGMRAAMFVEGGPEATLYVRTDGRTVSRTGTWSSRLPDDTPTTFLRIPNVIGFAPLDEASRAGGVAGEG